MVKEGWVIVQQQREEEVIEEFAEAKEEYTEACEEVVEAVNNFIKVDKDTNPILVNARYITQAQVKQNAGQYNQRVFFFLNTRRSFKGYIKKLLKLIPFSNILL